MSDGVHIVHPSTMRRVIMAVDDDHEIIDIENYQDIRMELNATGHNLVRQLYLFVPYLVLCFLKDVFASISVFDLDFCSD